MFSKRFFISFLSSAVVMFLLSGLWHMKLMGAFYAKYAPSGAPEHPNMVFIIFGYVLLAFVMTVLYEYFATKTLHTGIILGLLAGFIWVTPHAVIGVGALGMPIESMLVDGLWHIVEEGVGGCVIGYLYQKIS